MDAKICDRCGKVCAVEDTVHSRLGVDYYFDLCMDCRLWLLHKLGKKEKRNESGNM